MGSEKLTKKEAACYWSGRLHWVYDLTEEDRELIRAHLPRETLEAAREIFGRAALREATE